MFLDKIYKLSRLIGLYVRCMPQIQPKMFNIPGESYPLAFALISGNYLTGTGFLRSTRADCCHLCSEHSVLGTHLFNQSLEL